MPTCKKKSWHRAMSRWKLVVVTSRNIGSNLKVLSRYDRVAGIRVDGDFLVVRQGAFPDETITRINLRSVDSYVVEQE